MPTISGVTKNVSGTPESACIDVYRMDTGAHVRRVFSDATTGEYSVTTADTSPHRVVRQVAPITAGDNDWDSLVLALHMNGANGSTTFTDEKGHAVVANNGASISTAQSKFLGSSGAFDGSNDYLSLASSSDFDCGTSPFCLRFFFRYRGSSNTYPLILGNATGWSSGSIAVSIDHSFAPNKLCMNVNSFSSSTYAIASASTVSYDVWHHGEISRSGTSLRLFLDGVLESTVTISSGFAFNFGLGGIRIAGGNWDGSSSYFNGFLQDIQLYKKELHTASFSPPSSSFIGAPVIGTPTENAKIFDNVTPV